MQPPDREAGRTEFRRTLRFIMAFGIGLTILIAVAVFFLIRGWLKNH